MTIPPDPEVTVVKNHLTDPNNHPRKAVRVDAVVMASDTWRADHTGRVLGTSHTWTGENGCWRMPLLPYTSYDHDDYVYVQIVEDGSSPVYIQVQPPAMGKERWLRDLMVDPPKRPSGYRPISRLRDLGDVDTASTVDAPDGAVLVKRGGLWVAETPQFGGGELGDLGDVDSDSLDEATPGDTLEYLDADRGWGVRHDDTDPDQPPTLAGAFEDPGADVDPDGYTTRLVLTSRDPNRAVTVDWGDDTSTVLDGDVATADHIYDYDDTFWPTAAYTDADPASGDGDISAEIAIPYTRGHARMATTDDTIPNPKPVPGFSFTAAADEHVIRVRLAGFDGSYTLFWGDERTSTAEGNKVFTKPTPYPQAGAYMLTARDPKTREIIARGQVVVRNGTTVDCVEFAADPDDPQRIIGTFTEVEPVDIVPQVEIHWGDGHSTTAWAVPGATVEHYMQPGEYTRRVKDLQAQRTRRENITVEALSDDPEGTFAKSPSAAGDMTARFTVVRASTKPIEIDWGEGETTRIESPKAGSFSEYTYSFDGEYLPIAYYDDGTGRPTGGYVEVPFT